ncbi:MAG: hypothetical protein HY597_00610 [Candidatus Omnitrophica bacterium]|nr:hypothetical protein [Candidatus Omnitrophota bacterium]
MSRGVRVGWVVAGAVWALWRPDAVAAAAQPAPGQAVVGQKISLDLKGLDIGDVLKLLSQKSGLNFVASKNVTGKVTLFVQDVDVWDAFEIIVATNDLAYERKGSVVTVMAARDYEQSYGERFQDKKRVQVKKLQYVKASATATLLNQIKSNIGRIVVDEPSNTVVLIDVPPKVQQMIQIVEQVDLPTETRVFELGYGKADKLKDKVQELLTAGVGNLKMDERTNKIVVTDTPTQLDRIATLLTAFDAKARQVLIEAKVVEVILSDDKSLGIDWTLVLKNVLGDASGNPVKVRGSFDPANIAGRAADIISSSTSGSGKSGVAATFLLGRGQQSVATLVKALEKFGETRIISSPRIAVVDGQEAKILIGTKQPFVTSTTTVPSSGPTVESEQVTFVDVGVKLFVTPVINADDFIAMKIRPEVSSLGTPFKSAKTGNEFPVVTSTEAETNVLVEDGSTIIIAGLIEDRKEKTVEKIPFLGSIPLLGLPFQDKESKYKKTERVVFLTPHIITGDRDITTWKQDAEPPEEYQPPPPQPPVTVAALPLAYQALVRSRVAEAVTQQFRGTSVLPGEVTLQFDLARDGLPRGVPEVLRASEPQLGRLAAETVRLMRFEPFPPESSLQAATIRVTIAYEE